MEMEVKRIDKRQNKTFAANTWNSDESKIISVSQGAQNPIGNQFRQKLQANQKASIFFKKPIKGKKCMMEMKMEIIGIDKRQKGETNISNSDELEIIYALEEAQNVNINNGGTDKTEENPNQNLDTANEIPSVFLFDEDRRYKKEDLSYNFLALKWASWLKLSPFGVDENSWNFPRIRTSHKKWWQNGISFGWFLFASVRLLIAILSTAHFGMTGNAEENLGQMTLMIIATICGCIMIYVLFCCISSAQNMAPFLLSIFKYLDVVAKIESQQKKTKPRKFGFGFGGHTLKELLIIHLPFGVYLASGIIPLLSVVDPSFPVLLVSLVEPEISLSFLVLAALDSTVVLYYFMIVHMFFYLFIGMHRIQEETGLALKHLKTKTSLQTTRTPTENENENEKEESINIQKALKNLGLLHIWTCFLNRSFSNVVYCCKLIALTASISGGFGLIKMIEVENWPYAGIFALVFLEGNILYNLIFGRAFEIPEKVEELKREIRKEAFKTHKNNPIERKYVEKYLRSIPWLGVKDGVYKMERMTCVNFISFAVQQISSLVLAY